MAESPSMELIPKVSGKTRAAPMVMVNPGRQPTMIPPTVPKKRRRSGYG
jgi:hypothetical protein